MNIRTLVFALILLAGCGTASHQTKFLHRNADLGAIKKVAVLPFDNLTTEKNAGDKVQKIFFVELLSLEVFDVSEPGQVTKVLRAQPNVSLDALGSAELQKIGKELGVDALFTGSVVDFNESRAGAVPSPNVTVQLRLIETQSGATVWSTSQTRSGTAVSTKLFGVGGESLTEASRRVVRAELGTLLK